MITVSPQGEVMLCKTPLENDYKNQLTFTSLNDQLNYFGSKIFARTTNYSYIKKDNVIKVGFNIDSIINCNYLLYVNNGFKYNNGSPKMFMCFITNMEYVNENTTAITIETDVFQTWYFELNYKPCFIEREHVNNDSIGANTIPENLNLEKYVVNSNEDVTALNNMYICLVTSIDLNDKQGDKYKGLYGNPIGNTFSGLAYFVCPMANEIYLQTILDDVDKSGQSDGILAIFMVPSVFISTFRPITSSAPIQQVSSIGVHVVSTTKNYGSLNGYTPKNNKLFVWPYNLLNVTNNSGSNAELRYERFNGDCVFDVVSNLGINETAKIVPRSYNGIASNYDEGLMLSNYPVCAWTSNLFANYIAQNQNQINMGLLSTGLSTMGGVLTGVLSGNPLMVGGSVASGLSSVFNTIAKMEDIKVLPDQAKGSQNSGVNVNAGKQTFSLQKLTIPYNNAKTIDDYFSLYGYKVNTVKIPNITGRRNWNFVKTIDCNIEGDIPQTDLDIIRKMFNNGVTLWHNPSTMYNYSLNNGII